MIDQSLKFAEGFPMPTYEEWVAEVEKALKGAPFDKRMYTKTYEGVTLRPIYTRQDWPSEGDPSGFPASMPFTRGARAAGNRVANWDVRQSYAYPDPAQANDVILTELERWRNIAAHRLQQRLQWPAFTPNHPGSQPVCRAERHEEFFHPKISIRLLTRGYLDFGHRGRSMAGPPILAGRPEGLGFGETPGEIWAQDPQRGY